MQVTNRKERAKAKWRFAGLYILSVALPVLLLLNAIGMNKVECDDTAEYARQLRQRDQALAELSQLAATLNEAHQLKAAFDRAPEDQARYDRLHYEFEQGVDRLKRLYFSDTALYKHNYNLVTFLDFSHKEFDHIGEEFKGKVNEEVTRKMNALAEMPGGGGAGTAQIMMLTKDLKEADKTIARLERQLESAGKPGNGARNSEETEQLRSKAEAMDKNIEGINVLLAAIEEDANKIQRRGDDNRDAKKRILERLQNLKAHTANMKSSNDVLLSMMQ